MQAIREPFTKVGNRLLGQDIHASISCSNDYFGVK